MGHHDEAKLDVKFIDFARQMNLYLNFVGFRTWCSTRFVRKHSLYTFTRSAKRGLLESVISIIGHARRTASLRHLLTTLKANHHDLFNRLPPRCRFSHNPHPAPA